jgi:hypothetical protein
MDFITGMAIVCTIVTSDGWMNFNTGLYKARSAAECHQYSSDHGGKGMVAFYSTYDLDVPRDKKEFEIKCGSAGSDCKNANNRPRFKYNPETKQMEPFNG